MKRHKLLFVDDEVEILRTLCLTFEEDYEVFTATNGAAALGILEQQDIALIMADQRMPGMTGVQLLERSIHIKPESVRMILTGFTDTAALIQAINAGRIYQYITKPWEREELKVFVKRAIQSYELTLENQALLQKLKVANERLESENICLRKEVQKESPSTNIIAQSPPMRGVLSLVERVAGKSATVLLTGETGTGKTLLARYIHNKSPRCKQLFAEQNCGALPETLLESELFGHKRGAFTGAVEDRKGLFEAADGGTVFLDEISEMSATLQVKLLQILQDGRFRRLGDSIDRQVDVRIIAATNRDLQNDVQNHLFRSDLYYRINVFPIALPPLRERQQDIPILANHILNKHQRKINSRVTTISGEVLQHLCCYDYPGNVRELENLIERGLILSSGEQLEPGEWLPNQLPEPTGLTRMEQVERVEISQSLERHQGNVSLAAKDLGMARTTLWRRMRDYDIKRS